MTSFLSNPLTGRGEKEDGWRGEEGEVVEQEEGEGVGNDAPLFKSHASL